MISVEIRALIRKKNDNSKIFMWKRNTLLSIIAGTAVYMFLVQVVF